MSKIKVECFPGCIEPRNQYWKTNINGEMVYHREDGPAMIFIDIPDNNPMWGMQGTSKQEWWYLGEKIEVSSQEEFEQFLRLKAFW